MLRCLLLSFLLVPSWVRADDLTERVESEPDPIRTGSTRERVEAPCLRDPIHARHLRRPRESVRISLTHCDGRANLAAIEALSAVARAWRTSRPSADAIAAYRREHPQRARNWLSPRQRRMHPGLLIRLQALVDRWPERNIIIVSGHRPRARRGSRHRIGRALDLQIEGVDRAEVARFARGLEATGVGYYPRSTFTHIDVRDETAFWIDRSGPGQRADYGTWPGWGPEQEPAQEVRVARAALEARTPEPEPVDAQPAGHDDVAITAEEAQRMVREAITQGERTARIEVRRERTWFAGPVDWAPPW